MPARCLEAATARARYEILQDGGTYYGEIRECHGVYADARKLESCRTGLVETLEERTRPRRPWYARARCPCYAGLPEAVMHPLRNGQWTIANRQ